jgi:MFS family permease
LSQSSNTEVPSAVPAKPSHNTLMIVFMTVLIDLIGFGLIIPIQALYAKEFGARPALITLLGASYSLMQFLFMPMWGRISDRIGRRPVILMSVAIGGIGYLLFGFAGSIPVLFLSRMLAGFGNANIGVAQAIVADTTTAEQRARGMGLIGAAFGIGFVVGPAIGGVLGQISLATPAYAAAGLAAVNWGLAWFLLPETRRKDAAPTARRLIPLDALKVALRDGTMARLLLLSFVVTAGFSAMEQVFSLFIERIWVPEALSPLVAVQIAAHKHAAMLTTYAMITVGVTMVLVQGGLIGPLARRFGEIKLVRVGPIVMALGLLSLPLVGDSGSFALLLGSSVLLAVGSGMTTPALTSLLSRSAHADQQGAMLGLGQSMSALGRVAGPAMAGLMFEFSIGLPFLVGGTLTALAALVAFGISGHVGANMRDPTAHELRSREP